MSRSTEDSIGITFHGEGTARMKALTFLKIWTRYHWIILGRRGEGWGRGVKGGDSGELCCHISGRQWQRDQGLVALVQCPNELWCWSYFSSQKEKGENLLITTISRNIMRLKTFKWDLFIHSLIFFHSFDKHLACNNKRCMQLVENTGDIWTEQGLGVKNVGQHMEGKERHRIGVGGGWKSCQGSRNVTVGQYGEESEGLKEGRRFFRKREE